MKRLSAGILSAAALAGLAGSTAAYAWSSGADTPPTMSPQRPAEHPHAPVVRSGAPIRWAPCVAPAHLEQGVCVTDVVRTVVVPAPTPATPVAPPVTAPVVAGPDDTAATEEHADEPGEDPENGDDDGDHTEEPGD